MDIYTLILTVFIAIQGIYLIFYLIAFSSSRSTSADSQVPVSVIVCAHDEEENLRELIPILLLQDYPEYEVIVVEDRSNDGSFDFLYQAAKENSKIRMVQVKDKPDHINGKKFALTLGVKAAKHDWVLLTDADCRPGGPHWIFEMSKQFSMDRSIVIGYSPYLKEEGLLNSLIQYETLLTATHYIGMALMGRPYMGVGRNLAYRKSLFLNNKGFNEHLSVTGGDDDLFVNRMCTKQNTGIVTGTASLVYSKPKTTWAEFYFQKLRHLSVGKRYKAISKVNSGLFHLSLIGSWLLVVPATLFSSLIYIPISIFSVRLILLILLTHRASRKLGDPFEAWKAVYLDFVFVIYYLVVGLNALRTNKVRWKRT